MKNHNSKKQLSVIASAIVLALAAKAIAFGPGFLPTVSQQISLGLGTPTSTSSAYNSLSVPMSLSCPWIGTISFSASGYYDGQTLITLGVYPTSTPDTPNAVWSLGQ